ncbi:MAG: HAD family hydrolase [Myxococcota bacterium]|nr:HAD family hydrolase [Myxococcota bacterium]
MIRGVSFDLWDTIVIDDSDELDRAKLGLRTKHDERRFLLQQALPLRQTAEVDAACDSVDVEFRHAWKVEYCNWTVDFRLRRVFEKLGEVPQEEALAKAVYGWEVMELNHAPRLIDGAEQAISELASRYQLAICSDAIVSPGKVLRQLLEKHGLKKYFSSFAYSDEVGRSKPHRSMFDVAAAGLNLPVDQMVHIGDRHSNDVEGPHAIGMKAILFTASRDADKAGHSADALCEKYSDLANIIDDLAKQ